VEVCGSNSCPNNPWFSTLIFLVRSAGGNSFACAFLQAVPVKGWTAGGITDVNDTEEITT